MLVDEFRGQPASRGCYRVLISAKSLVGAKHDFLNLPLPDSADLYVICIIDY